MIGIRCRCCHRGNEEVEMKIGVLIALFIIGGLFIGAALGGFHRKLCLGIGMGIYVAMGILANVWL